MTYTARLPPVWDESHFKPERGFVGGYYLLGFHLGIYALAAGLVRRGWGREYASILERYEYMAGCSMVGEDMPTPVIWSRFMARRRTTTGFRSR